MRYLKELTEYDKYGLPTKPVPADLFNTIGITRAKKEKLNKIIASLSYSAEYAENSASLKRIVKRLEKFRDEEL